MFQATRPAPPRPSSRPSLPLGHPFSTYISPSSSPFSSPTHSKSHKNDSQTSLLTSHTSVGGNQKSSPSSPTSPSSTISSKSNKSLSAPLFPRHFSAPPHTQLGHYTTSSLSSYPYKEDRREPTPAYTIPPPDLAFLDHKPRQSLLRDLEIIFNKKLRFPFIERHFRDSIDGVQVDEEVLDKTMGGKDGKYRNRWKGGKKLIEERCGSGWMDDFAWDGVELIDDQRARSGYKGVREGNWI